MRMEVGYARVSTAEQDTSLQRLALGSAGCSRVFEETASGGQRDRPELAAALDFVRPGDTLIVWKLDRLARSLKQLIETVEDLERRGVSFVSLTENIDTTSPGGKLTFHIFAALAEFERGLIRERTLAGLASAKAQGRTGGRPRKMNEADIEAAKLLLSDNRFTTSDISQRLGVSPATLYRHLPGGRSSI